MGMVFCWAIVFARISALEPAYRAVVQLRDVEGLSTQQTAQALDLTPSAVKTRLQRARMKLRENLNNHFRPTRASGNQGRCTGKGHIELT
jgi:RNA polymerase sigma-70 factor (ECF subfamily)